MTLIELMAALAIAAAVSAGALAVTAGLGRSGRAGAADQTRYELGDGLHRLLEAELAHAERYRKTPGGFQLQGHWALEGPSARIAHLPATVTYELKPSAGRKWLVRTQQVENLPPRSDLVAAGVESIELRTKAEGRPVVDREGWRAVSSEAAVVVRMDTGTQEVFDFRLR